MDDVILKTRLDTLFANLNSAQRSHECLEKELEALHKSDLKYALRATISHQARNRRKDLARISISLKKKPNDPTTIENAWRDYTRLCKLSDEINDEFLEVLGGLTIRTKRMDDEICEVADELIRNCIQIGPTQTKSDFLTVPASHEALKKTLARVVRLRFPDLSIWTLPLTVHELGHVVVEDYQALRDLSDELAGSLFDSDAGLQNVVPKKGPKVRAIAKVNELLADAFATYMMGPAYACSAIFLRFNPVSAYTSDLIRPSEAERALIVLGMLEKMNEEAGKPPPYQDVIKRLKEAWDNMLVQAKAKGKVSESQQRFLKELVRRVWEELEAELQDLAKYPPGLHGEGWLKANEWHKHWQNNRQNKSELTAPQVKANNRLRDVLNAAWLFWIYNQPLNVKEITVTAHSLCCDIIEKLRKQEHREHGKRASSSKIGRRDWGKQARD